jgi:4-diphosphocytidyl-2-C-methyl-D-erythritol kinase
MGKNPEAGISCTIEAPCKINLHLRIKGRRPNGYHDLESIFLPLVLGDTLFFELTGGEGACDIQTEWAPPVVRELIPPEKNLVFKAAALFRARTGFSPGLKVVLKKRIPPGAGLGGGSSDAASTLMALDRLAGTGLSRRVLAEMAGKLGSDVPFFLSPGTAFVSGRGERIRKLRTPEGFSVALVNPGFSSGTAGAFQLLDRIRLETANTAAPPRKESPGVLIKALAGPPSAWPYGNDFLPAFLNAETKAAAAYRDILGALKEMGAEFSGLSGAGSTCFGIFIDGGMAEKAVNSLLKRWNFVQLTFPLARTGNAVLE